jgi:putative addiction module component (TIGR02574 family)
MSVTAEQVCLEALSLPRDARAELAHRLLTSLETADLADDVSEAWRDEIERRREEFRTGRAQVVTADEALRRAEAALG